MDGIYGPLTENAVKRLQKRAGLVVDGIVGPHTWKALRG
ncbi:peptidoglycan-binding protein [Streptomyces mexicanus]